MVSINLVRQNTSSEVKPGGVVIGGRRPSAIMAIHPIATPPFDLGPADLYRYPVFGRFVERTR